MSWIFYSTIVVITSILYVLISKKILNDKEDHDPVAYASIAFLIVAVYATIFYAVTSFTVTDFQHLLDPRIILLLAIDFILYTIAPSFYYRVLKKLPASEVQILYTLLGMFALFIGAILGTELFHLNRLLGGIFILGAVVLVTQQDGKWKLGKYALMLIFSTVLYGAAAVADNFIITKSLFTIPFFQIIQFGIPGLMLLVVNPKSAKRVKSLVTHGKTIKTMGVNSFFFFLNYLFIFKAYKSGGSASQVNMFFSIETVITVIFAAIFLKERNRLVLKITASLLATMGVILLAQ